MPAPRAAPPMARQTTSRTSLSRQIPEFALPHLLARHHLLAHDTKYDVIISDLFVPWESESGYLYTVEHYQVAASRLKPDGMFCQWLPLYQLGPREFESIANSFASVFPSTTIWWAQLETTSPVIGLIGKKTPLKVDIDSLNKRNIQV